MAPTVRLCDDGLEVAQRIVNAVGDLLTVEAHGYGAAQPVLSLSFVHWLETKSRTALPATTRRTRRRLDELSEVKRAVLSGEQSRGLELETFGFVACPCTDQHRQQARYRQQARKKALLAGEPLPEFAPRTASGCSDRLRTGATTCARTSRPTIVVTRFPPCVRKGAAA